MTVGEDFKRHRKERKWHENDVGQLYRDKKNVYLKTKLKIGSKCLVFKIRMNKGIFTVCSSRVQLIVCTVTVVGSIFLLINFANFNKQS